MRNRVLVLLLAVVASACGRASAHERPSASIRWSGASAAGSAAPSATASPPPVVSSRPRPPSVYANIATSRLSPRVAHVRPEVYVPNNDSNTVDVIDPRTFRVVRVFAVGAGPQHITPSWNLRWLYVGNTYSNSLTVIDPRTARPVRTIDVPDPYNLYFTPDGRLAVDVAERLSTLFLFRWPSWRPAGSIPIPWSGADHLDFSRNGRYLLLSTEFGGRVVRVDLRRRRVVGSVDVGGSPVDVKLSRDGRVFFVANQDRGGVSVIDPRRMREIRFIPTGAGAHGMAVARNGRQLYVSNRLAGTISVIDFATRRVVRTFRVGGSPDMLQVSADGRLLWVSNRYDGTVSVVSTRTGRLLHTIAVGSSPHGLTLFPQPGRFSIGHNGVYR
jgi:YVTN family beta-propeller protein